MSPVSVPVEESRAQRQQRLQARFRDRGGIFVPSEKNTLIDILLSRSVTGESPSKRSGLKQRQENKTFPGYDKGKSKVLHTSQEHDSKQLPHSKATGKSKADRTSFNKPGKQKDSLSDGGQPVAGPSQLDNGRNNSAIERAGDKCVSAVSAPKRKGRPPKGKLQTHPPKNDVGSNTPQEKAKPAPKRRGRPAKSKPPTDADVIDMTSTEIPAKRKKTTKKRQRATQSDDEADGVSSDYMPPSRKCAKVAPCKSASEASRKKQIKAIQSEDSDDDCALVIAVQKPKADSASDLKKFGLFSNNPRMSTEGDDSSSRSTSKSCQASKVQTQLGLYMDDEGETGSRKIERTTRNTRDSKVTSKPKSIVMTKSSKTLVTTNHENDGPDSNEAPLKDGVKAKTAVKSNRTTNMSKTGDQLRRRQRDVAESEQSALPLPMRKRAKTIQPPELDKVSPESIDAGYGTVTHRAENMTRKLKENDDIPKCKSTAQRAKQLQPKPSQKEPRRGPPQEVLNRIKARPPPSSPHVDSDRDPIDFLS